MIRGYMRMSKPHTKKNQTKADAERELASDTNFQKKTCRQMGAKVFYSDVVSSLAQNRPQFEQMMRDCNPGDTIVTYSLSRFARTTAELLAFDKTCRDRKITFKTEKEHISNSEESPYSQFMFHILAAVAQLERDMIRERLMDQQQSARENGVHIGRKRKLTPEMLDKAHKLLATGMSGRAIARDLKINPKTFAGALRTYGHNGHVPFKLDEFEIVAVGVPDSDDFAF